MLDRAFDLAVVGGGAGGLLLLWHRLRLPNPPKNILWLDASGRFGRGPAYATQWPQHLLNVPARNMGAIAEQPGHFLLWLNGPEGQATATAHHLPTTWRESDYVPRLLYGAYLQSFLADLERCATQLGVALHRDIATIAHIESADGYLLQAEDGRRWHTQDLALAMGNQPNPPWGIPTWQDLPHPGWLGRMWDWSAALPQPLPRTDSSLPALILGSGLTGVDALLQLRAAGWVGRILMLSRHAALPAAHAAQALPPGTLPAWPVQGAGLSEYLHRFRIHLRSLPDWRMGVDALRPQTTELWQRLSPTDQRRFWTRLGPWWNIHRHRMAASIAQVLQEEITSGQLSLVPMHIENLRGTAQNIEVLGRNGKVLQAAWVVDCTGPSYDLRRQPGALAPLLQSGHLTLTANGLGIEMNESGLACRVPGRIVALGALTLGMRLESVAMPELRNQARDAAHVLSEG